MSKFVGFIVGTALVVAGILTGNVALIIQGGAMIVSNAIMLLTMPKAPARNASEMAIQLGEQPRVALFGETFTAGSLVDGFNYGGKYGTDWEVLIIRLADHKCHSLTGFYVNDEFYAYTHDGVYTEFDGGDLQLYFRNDTTTDPLPAIVTTHGPGWTSADIGESGCDVIVAYKADKPTEKKPAWPGGRPRFGFVVKGKLCYDPRGDTTGGGFGGQRFDDPATWEYSQNAAVCRYNWVRGIYANDAVDDPTQLLVGRGLSSAEAPSINIIAAANLCDEMVNGEVRYRVAGPVYSTQPHLEVETMFAAATGGSIVTREGSVELEPGAAKSVVASFTDDDLLSGSEVSWNQGVLSESSGEWVNTVVARYVEPTQKWADHAAPVVRSNDDILSDGRPRETQITLRLVRDSDQALRVAEIARRLGRLWGRAQVSLGPRFCELEDGDWIGWQSDTYFGGATKVFRIEAYSIDEKWQNRLTLREMDAAVFGPSTFDPDLSEVNPNPPPADPDAPGTPTLPGDPGWSLTAAMLTSAGASIPALVFSGSVDDPDASQVVFEYWLDDGVSDPVADPDSVTWTAGGTYDPSVTRAEITSIVGGATYYGAVSYVLDGFWSARLVLGPVTVGELTVTATFASAAEIRAGAVADKPIAPDQLHLAAAFQTLTPGATISWDMALGFNAECTLDGSANAIQTPTNPKEGQTYSLLLIQDATGGRTVSWPAAIGFGAAGTPTLSTGAGKMDLVSLQCIDAAGPTFRAAFNADA